MSNLNDWTYHQISITGFYVSDACRQLCSLHRAKSSIQLSRMAEFADVGHYGTKARRVVESMGEEGELTYRETGQSIH